MEAIGMSILAYAVGVITVWIISFVVRAQNTRNPDATPMIVMEFESPDGASEFVLVFDTPLYALSTVEMFESMGYKLARNHAVDAILNEQYDGMAVLSTNTGDF